MLRSFRGLCRDSTEDKLESEHLQDAAEVRKEDDGPLAPLSCHLSLPSVLLVHCVHLFPSYCVPQRIVTGRQWVFVLGVRFGGSWRDEVGSRRGGEWEGSMEISLRRGWRGCIEEAETLGERRGVSGVRRGNDGRQTGGSGAGGLN